MRDLPSARTEPQFGENDQPLTDEEAKAIQSLRRLAKRWPQSLKLLSAAGSLIIIHTDQEYDERHGCEFLPQDAPLAHIYGIPNDGGDPW